MSGKLINRLLIWVAVVGFALWGWETYYGRGAIAKKSKPHAVPTVIPISRLEAPQNPFNEREMALYQKILVSFATGNYAATVTQIETLLASNDISESFRQWLSRQWPITMTSMGWIEIKGQDCDAAIKTFYRVLGHSLVPEAQKGLGFCLRAEKNYPEAASFLAAYVLANARDIEGRLIYADTLESLGRFEEAVTILEGALVAESLDAATREMVASRLSGMRAKSKTSAKRKTEQSEHFFMSYREEEHDDLLPQVLDVLENSVLEYSQVFGFAMPRVPIEVVLYRKEEFHNVIPGGPGWAEGVFDGRMRVPVSETGGTKISEGLITILRHELAHAVMSMRSNGRTWPTWFEEGMAQYLSCRRRSCDYFQFPATLGGFSDRSVLERPLVTLDSIDAGRAYMHSLFMVRGMVRARGESVIDMISVKLPSTGAIRSDDIAALSGWESFQSLWTDMAGWWKNKERF